jgi:hypothetical protein
MKNFLFLSLLLAAFSINAQAEGPIKRRGFHYRNAARIHNNHPTNWGRGFLSGNPYYDASRRGKDALARYQRRMHGDWGRSYNTGCYRF